MQMRTFGTVEKLTLNNMGIAFGILFVGGTEPEIHLGVIYPPLNCNICLKKYRCNTRVNDNHNINKNHLFNAGEGDQYVVITALILLHQVFLQRTCT